jgi:hypothetical protein
MLLYQSFQTVLISRAIQRFALLHSQNFMRDHFRITILAVKRIRIPLFVSRLVEPLSFLTISEHHAAQLHARKFQVARCDEVYQCEVNPA